MFSNAGGGISVQVLVNPVLPKLGMSPLPIAVPPTGGARSFFVSLSSPDNIEHVASLASSNTSVVTISPASVTFAPGETEKLVSVAGQAVGLAAINLSSPALAPNSIPVFVTAEFTGITTSYAPPLQVVVEQAPGSSSTSFGPIASPHVGIVKGAYFDAVSPNRLAVGTGPTSLVITGSELGGVTGVTLSPADGLTLGAPSVAPDGRSVTVPVTVAANAATTLRKVTLAGAEQPYMAANPNADQVLVTLPPPQIESIDPIFATAGTTAMTLTVRGRNLQSPQAVSLTPNAGITVSNTPSVNLDGTVLTVSLSVAPLAPTGPRTVTVTTAGGTSDATAAAANTFSIVNEVQAVHTPIASALLGVVREDSTPPAAQSLSAFASHVGVVVPPAATGIAPAVGIVGTTVQLTVSGVGLGGVTAVQLSPADGLVLGAPSVNAEGTALSVSVGISADAPQTLREVRLFAGPQQVLFTNASASLFRVSAPLPQFDSMTPIVLEVGASAVTLTITGRNFQNASLVRVEPAAGITVSPPSVNGSGTQATVTVSAAAGTATGPRSVILATPAGESAAAQSAANTLTLANTIQGSVTPVASAALGVMLETDVPPASSTFGPFAAPALGVVLEDPSPPASPDQTTRATSVGVAVGPFASGVQVPPLTPSSAQTLVISGIGLADVTAVQIDPPANITVGTLTIAPDGTQVSAPLSLFGAAAGLRGVRVLRGTETVPFVPAGMNTFRVGVGAPSIDSISPILESPGQIFTLILRGQNVQDVTAVTVTPGTGIAIDNVPTVNAAGTEVTVRVSIVTDAPAGSHVFRVHTPGGATTDAAIPANTFTVLE